MPVPLPDTKEHRELVDLVRRRLRSSEDALSPRHEHWRRSERTYRLFVDPAEVQEGKEAVTEAGELLYTYPTSIVVPLSYAITQTLVAFWLSLFTAGRPYFKVGFRDEDSKGPARAQELLLSYQLDYVGVVPLLYNWLLDSCRYGMGITKNIWDVMNRNQTVRRFLTMPGPDGPIRIQLKEKRPVLEYEGNWPEVIDPFSWRPDHRWPVGQFQRGSFCGEALWRSYFELLRQQKRGIYEHIDEIPTRTSEHFKESQSDRDRIMQANQYFGLSYSVKYNMDTLVLVEECPMDIIPRASGLGESDNVERWVLTVANRTVLIRAEEFPYDHNDYNYAVIESSPDWHSLVNPGVVEIMEPVHQHITWFLNTMVENGRKFLNDRIVYDPSIISSEDLLSPTAGKTIRVNREYWGIPGSVEAIKQLSMTDIATNNLRHVGFLISLLERISAATEMIQGQVEEEGRTATEITGAAQQGATRLRAMARMFSATGFVPLARQMVQNNMQLITQETYINIAGPLEEEYRGIGRAVGGDGILISPEDVQGLFNFPVSDASAPLDPVRFARTWVQIMQLSTAHPVLGQSIDHLAVWKEMIRSMGVPDPARFVLPQQVQVMPDAQLQRQVQAGNLVPGPLPQQMRAPAPQQLQAQSVQGEENRPMPFGR